MTILAIVFAYATRFRVFVASLFLLCISLACTEAFAGTYYPSQAAAQAACSAYVAGFSGPYVPATISCTMYPIGSTVAGTPLKGGINYSIVIPSNLGSGYAYVGLNAYGQGDYFYWLGVVAPTCTAGQGVPAGTQVNNFPSTGETCQNSCEVAMQVGGALSGSYVLNGNMCLGTGTGNPKSLTKPSQTKNADGSTTFCDPLSGKCVTSGGTNTSAPPPSSSPNHTTDTASTTNNPATSSSTTTTSTSTTTGDGTGGTGGTGNSTTTTTGHSTTSAPASSSSTASKCTDGVCDVGNADGDTGLLYQAGTDTPGSVYGNFQSQVSSAPIVSAVTGFFTVTTSGSCPTWHIPGNKYWGAAGFDFTFFCDSAVLAIMALAGYVVLAMAAFSAVRIAIY